MCERGQSEGLDRWVREKERSSFVIHSSLVTTPERCWASVPRVLCPVCRVAVVNLCAFYCCACVRTITIVNHELVIYNLFKIIIVNRECS